ncbi:MAG: hypothetical protein QOH08_935 [Chloroflexota bacterium]|jgi:hypothetical protein|nr:hypothetical protein [Chloroflexota bacterium]
MTAARKRAYVVFDVEHDADVVDLLVTQSRNPDSPFEVVDRSTGDPEAARARIRAADVAVVLCGEYTGTDEGVNAELRILQEEAIPYFLLRGRFEIWAKPEAARPTEKTYGWTWPHLKTLIGGGR